MSQKMEEKNVEDRNINRKSNPKTNRPLPHEKQNGNHDRSTSTASLNPAMRYRLKKLNSKEESKNDIIEQNKSQKCDHLEGVGELYHKDNNSYSDDEDLDNSDSTSKIRSCSNNSNESNRNSDKKKNEFNTEISKGINKSENAKNFNRSNKINGKSFENEKEFKEAKRLRIAMLKRRYAALNPVPFDPYAIPVIVKDLIDFVTLPFQSKQGTVMRCFIERAKGFVVPTYTLFSDHEDGSGRMIMTAQKTMISNTSYYTISLNPDDLSKRRGNRSIQYLGKLRGNRALTEYILYDNGSTPEEIEEMKIDFDGIDEEDRPQIRKELAAISFLSGRGHSAYTANLKSIKGGNSSSEGKYDGDSSEEENADLKVDIDVRKMEVGIPKVHYHFPLEDNGKPDLNQPEVNRMEKWSPRVAKESLKEGLNRIQFQGLQNVLDCNRIIVMHQKESKYDPISSCLCDFKGRATAPSTKNFQIIFSSPEDTDAKDHFFSSEGEGREVNSDPEAAQPILLQMGRVGNDCFNVDLQHPLSILQAFAICLAKFDSKR